MKKYLIGVILCFMLAFTACESEEADKAQVDDKGNQIEYVEEANPVMDDSVFGDNVLVFSTEDNISDVQKRVDEIYDNQETNQFGNERYALLFKAGEYDKSLEVNVGYYTQISGLGLLPTDTNINKLWVNADWMGHNATCNFWRSCENVAINEKCMWANSQAVSLRRVNFDDDVVLSDGEGWSSGGFMADCHVTGTVYSGSQQQYLFRNNSWGFFNGGVWNMVYVGQNPNKIPENGNPTCLYTKVEKTPEIEEKPFVIFDEVHGYGLVLPEKTKESQGTSWEDGVKGTFISLNKFHIANPKDDTADTINNALNDGKHILFTPGVYKIDKPIEVKNENTIVYGMGLATLVATNGNVCMKTSDVDGIKVCGLLFDAGDSYAEEGKSSEEVISPTLLQVGEEKTDVSHKDNPICFSDVYFRVGGGEYAGKVQNCVTINSNNVIGDHFWVWRGDHSTNVGWDVNTAPNGIIINGDNVTMYGLFVEHFQEYQTVWNGQGGRLYFYQSEMPYDAPNQKSYKSHDGKVNGYSSIKVSDNVNDFKGYGIGIYCYNRDAEIEIERAMEVPKVEGVRLENVVSVKLNGNGQITHVVNDVGDPVTRPGWTSRVKEYENDTVRY